MVAVVSQEGNVLLSREFDLEGVSVDAAKIGRVSLMLLTIFATSCSVPTAMTTFGVGGSKFDHLTV
jgi:hypothetical protein